MAVKKIVLIGAGSASFTQGLVADMMIAAGGQEWKLGLVDISPEALDMVKNLVQRMIQTRGAKMELSASTDRRDILPGASAVVTTIAVGGRRAWEADVLIPRKYGVFQPVGDSIMSGGVSRSMRQIPAMIAIAADVASLCPGAHFFNYSNPMTTICRAVRRATGVPVVGLCHGVLGWEKQLAAFAGFNHKDVTSIAVGVNHLTWFMDFRCRGKDAWPVIRARLAQERNQPFDTASLGAEFPEMGKTPQGVMRAADNPFCWELFETYGAFPCPGDRHVSEFFPQRFPGGKYYGKTLGVDAFSFEKTVESGDARFQLMKDRAYGRQPLEESIFRRVPGEHEQLVSILDCIETDGRRFFSMNVPNRGAVANLPSEAVIELPVAACARSLTPMHIGALPAFIAAILNARLAAYEVTVEAALTGSRKLFVEALLADGAITDPIAAIKMADELLAAHKQHLPQFA
jgi:alpha-galactosidase